MTGATSVAQAQQATSIGQPAANAPGWSCNIAPYLWLPNKIPSHDQPMRRRKIIKRLHLQFSGIVVRRLFAVAIVGFATALGGCGDDGIISRLLLKPGDIIIERRPDVAYERLFPYYVELCAASQFRAKLDGRGRHRRPRSHVSQGRLQR